MVDTADSKSVPFGATGSSPVVSIDRHQRRNQQKKRGKNGKIAQNKGSLLFNDLFGISYQSVESRSPFFLEKGKPYEPFVPLLLSATMLCHKTGLGSIKGNV